MGAVEPNIFPLLQVRDANNVAHDITDSVTSISLNFTIDAGTELTVEVTDMGRRMLRNQYFNLGQVFAYGISPFQITSIDVSQGEGSSARIRLQMLDLKFQQLKQDFNPQAYRAANGFFYAQKIAQQYGLKFEGENVKGKQQSIKVKTKNNRESVWAVLQRSAGDNQFLCFIAEGTLFFLSPKSLIGRWGIDTIQYQPEGETTSRAFSYVPLVYPTPESEKRFFLVSIPDMRKSIDTIKEGEGSATIFGPSARNLRAGMTVMVYGMGSTLSQPYIVTSVDYEDRSVEPVKINFANISRLAPEDKAKIDEKISEVTVIDGDSGGESE